MQPLGASEARLVASAVVGDRLGTLPSASLLRSGLAPIAHASGAAPQGRPEVIEAFARAMIHHRTVRAELAPLLSAWARAGLRILVFKGFALAEWLYDPPAGRPYGDVDVLMDRAEASAAAALAVEQGWRVPWRREASDTPHKHEEMQLVSPTGVAQLDVHRFVVHCASPLDRVQRRITAEAWAGSVEIRLDGVPLRTLRPEDAVLIGLVLNRFWSPDDLTLKPQDYYDSRTIAAHGGLSADDLTARARELGCARTWRLFLSRCDPWSGRLDLTRPGLALRQWYLAQIALERPHPHLEDLMMRLPVLRSAAAGSRR